MTTYSTRFFLCLLFALVVASRLVAQTTNARPDVIYKLDNTSIQAIISEVTDAEVLYRRANNPNGPVFRIRRRDIQSIRYANGEVEQFNQAPAPAPAPPAEQPAPRYEPAPRTEPAPRYESAPRYEPQSRQRYEPRPRYERPARQPSSGGYAFERGHPMFNGGIMLPSGLTPFTLAVEFPAGDDFGIGGRLWYISKDGDTDFTVQAIANYHLARAFNAQNGNIDPFVGVGIGKTFVSYSGGGGSTSGDIAANIQLGLRYLVNGRVGPYGQLNIGIFNRDQTNVFGSSSAVFELGVAVKLGR